MKCSKLSIIATMLLLSSFLLACKGNESEELGNEDVPSESPAVSHYILNDSTCDFLLASVIRSMNDVSLADQSKEAKDNWEKIKASCRDCTAKELAAAFQNSFGQSFDLNVEANTNLLDMRLTPELLQQNEQVGKDVIIDLVLDHFEKNDSLPTYTFSKFLKRKNTRKDQVRQQMLSYVGDLQWIPVYQKEKAINTSTPKKPKGNAQAREDKTNITEEEVKTNLDESSLTLNAVTTEFTVEELTGDIVYSDHANYIKLEKKYLLNATGNSYLHKDAAEAYKRMADDAEEEGISLKAISCGRNFKAQKSIWEKKWIREDFIIFDSGPVRCAEIMRFSSMPGTSRHHWGTEIDIHSLKNSSFSSGKGLEIYEWLTKNAKDYGFYQPYTAGRDRGYEEEKWHWSYYPISGPMLEQFNAKIDYTLITGFNGSEYAQQVGAIENYVNGIAPAPNQ